MPLRGTLDHRTHLVHERIAARRAILEERIGAHPSRRPSISSWIHARLPFANWASETTKTSSGTSTSTAPQRPRHPVAGSVADPDHHPTRTWIAPVDEQLLGQRVDGVALVGHHHVVRATGPITGPPVVHRRHGSSCVPGRSPAPHRRIRRLDPGPSQLIDRHRGLHRQLSVGGDVQEVAATTAFQLVSTRHRHSIRRRIEHRHHTGSRTNAYPSARPRRSPTRPVALLRRRRLARPRLGPPRPRHAMSPSRGVPRGKRYPAPARNQPDRSNRRQATRVVSRRDAPDRNQSICSSRRLCPARRRDRRPRSRRVRPHPLGRHGRRVRAEPHDRAPTS